jgi:hypothetical protein
MPDPSITDWLGSIGTAAAATAALIATIYTRLAARASADAAMEAAKQVRELQLSREPRAEIVFRVPDQLTGQNQLLFGRGNNEYRSGTPVYLDIWNVSNPTIMVMEVTGLVDGALPKESWITSLTPQVPVESGSVQSVNVAYLLMSQVSQDEFLNVPNGVRATAKFTVRYLSVGGDRLIEAACNFHFVVTDQNIFTFTIDQKRPLLTGGGGNYVFAQRSQT